MRERQIELFLAVAAAGSLAAAASRLGLAQSALSRHVAALEREVGAALFERRPDGARLTPAGRAYLLRAGAIQDAFEAARRAATAT
jgi:DNA-binding transcriptional LysR family regulator